MSQIAPRPGYTFWQIFEKRFLDEKILDLFSDAHTEESQQKSRNYDLPKCVLEGRFDICKNDFQSMGTYSKLPRRTV